MEMTIRQYAQDRHITYEGVRRQLKRYAEELGDHVKKVEGVTKLDEFAQDLLDRHRQPRPVIVTASDDETQQQITELSAETGKLRHELSLMQQDCIAAQEKYITLQKDLIESRKISLELGSRYKTLENDKERELMQKDLEIMKKDAEIQRLAAELAQYQKSIFGLYKRVKIPAEVQDHDGKEET